MRLNYLEAIAAKSLEGFLKSHVLNVFPGFTTVNKVYKQRLLELRDSLKKYIEDETLNRPFLYLILGPPGAGKSYLINRLIAHLSEGERKLIRFQPVNLSEMIGPSELHKLYLAIINNSLRKAFTVTLLDEFDIKWEGGSAIKYLINPIYDGKFWDGSKFQSFNRCAFFFAGSYLQDHATLLKTQRLLAGVNLNEFLFDFYLEMLKRGNSKVTAEIKELQEFCYTHQKWSADIDPHVDSVQYLKNLEKIKDFLSRVAGNVFEIIDVSAPLSLTQNEFIIIRKGAVSGAQDELSPSIRLKVADIIAYAKMLDEVEGGFASFEQSYTPTLEYKNVLLCERLLRILDFIKKRFKRVLKNEREVEIDRRLLNFLTVTPLINGMRSLEQLVNKLEQPAKGRFEIPSSLETGISMIIHDAKTYADPLRIWDRIAEANKNYYDLKALKDNYITIPLS